MAKMVIIEHFAKAIVRLRGQKGLFWAKHQQIESLIHIFKKLARLNVMKSVAEYLTLCG